jgi:hypothetical protein
MDVLFIARILSQNKKAVDNAHGLTQGVWRNKKAVGIAVAHGLR